MFVRFKKRKLKSGTALDIILLKSYRPAPGQRSTHKFIKQWTIRKSELYSADRRAWFVDDIKYDLNLAGIDVQETKKILASVRKKLRE